MKVKVKGGGFFYDGRVVVAGEEVEVPKEVGKSWLAAELADEVKPGEAAKAAASRKKRAVQPSERTVAPGPQETRGDRAEA